MNEGIVAANIIHSVYSIMDDGSFQVNQAIIVGIMYAPSMKFYQYKEEVIPMQGANSSLGNMQVVLNENAITYCPMLQLGKHAVRNH